VVMAQVGNSFTCRTEVHRGRYLGWTNNKILLYGNLVSVLLILVLIYFPPLARIFHHEPIPPLLWIWLGFYAPTLYGLDWLRKYFLRRFGATRNKEEQTSRESPDNETD